jgi:hypothetical protein
MQPAASKPSLPRRRFCPRVTSNMLPTRAGKATQTVPLPSPACGPLWYVPYRSEKGHDMLRIRILPALLALALSCGLASSADARKWRSYHHDNSSRYGDNESRRPMTPEGSEVGARAASGGGAFGAVVDQLVRGCAQRGAELDNWPFDDIARIAAPDELQSRSLEALRAAAKEAAKQLALDCPQQVSAVPSARLEAVEQGIDTTLAVFGTLQPTLQAFYGALNDEQKARLLRDLTMSAGAARSSERTREQMNQRSDGRSAERRERRSRWRAYAQAPSGGGTEPGNRLASRRIDAPILGGGVCENFAAALRGFPIREVERSVQLSEQQRVAFYEFVTASLKAADTLVTACPAATAITPVRRMEGMLARLAAVRATTAAIRPTLTRFYEALDQGQKVRFAAMS